MAVQKDVVECRVKGVLLDSVLKATPFEEELDNLDTDHEFTFVVFDPLRRLAFVTGLLRGGEWSVDAGLGALESDHVPFLLFGTWLAVDNVEVHDLADLEFFFGQAEHVVRASIGLVVNEVLGLDEEVEVLAHAWHFVEGVEVGIGVVGLLVEVQVLVGDGPADEGRNLGFEVHDFVGVLALFAVFFEWLVGDDFNALAATLSLACALATHVEVPDLVLRHVCRQDDTEFDNTHVRRRR